MIDPTDFSPLEVDAATAARRLLGAIIEREIDGELLRVRIVEVEAYDQDDLASHAITGPTGRAKTMFGPAGRAYVYFIYGMHYSCNVVTGGDGFGSGVLIRAVEPLQGKALLSANRGGKTGVVVTNGPAKLCEALRIDRALDGHDLRNEPLKLLLQPALDPLEVVTTTRIGITKAVAVEWRFYIKGNSYVSTRGV